MSDTENPSPPSPRPATPTDRFALLERRFQAVLDEWKEEKGRTASQRDEIVSLRGEVGGLVSGAKEQLRQSAEALLQEQQQQYTQLVGDYNSQKDAFDQLVIDYNSQKSAFDQLVGNYSTQKDAFDQLVGEYSKQKDAFDQLVQNCRSVEEEYKANIDIFDKELQRKEQEYITKAQELQEAFTKKDIALETLYKDYTVSFKNAQKNREKQNEQIFDQFAEKINVQTHKMVKFEDDAENLINQINDIIPGAATVKLAKSFSDAEKRYGSVAIVKKDKSVEN